MFVCNQILFRSIIYSFVRFGPLVYCKLNTARLYDFVGLGLYNLMIYTVLLSQLR